MRNEVRKTPFHSNITSSNYPRIHVENNNALENDVVNYIEAEATAKAPKVSFLQFYYLTYVVS